MIDIKINMDLFNGVKVPFLITCVVVILIIIVTIYFVSKEVKKWY